MNSIDTFVPTLIPQLDSEEGITAPIVAPDAAALEALRALMGGLPPPPAASDSPCSLDDATLSPKSPATLPAVLEQLLKSDGLPAALIPSLTTLRENTLKGGTPQSDPALVAEMRTLLRGMVPAQTDSAQPATFSIPLPILKATALGGGAELGTSGAQPQTPGLPLPGAVVISDIGLPPAAFNIMQPAGTSLPGSVMNTDSLLSPTTLTMANTPALPADLPALAQALLQILEATPEPTPSSVVMPSFASLIEDETAPSQERPADTPNLGSTILHSLGHQSTPASSAQPTDKTVPASAVERVSEVSNLITQMADRVLVTDPLHGQTQEVRIKIADNVMQGTEVRVWREDGGALRVEFDTTSAYWSRILNDASPLLSLRLNERLPSGTEAQVTVTVQQHGQQPEDGRSRNRHNPWELAQQAQES